MTSIQRAARAPETSLPIPYAANIAAQDNSVSGSLTAVIVIPIVETVKFIQRKVCK